MLLRFALAAALLLAAGAAHAQRAVSGTVTDASTGEALIGVSVAVLGPDGAVVGGTTTNLDGRFSLSLISFPARLAVRSIGYASERLVVSADSGPLSVALQPDEAALGEAVVVAGEDPALRLLRRVIARVRGQRDALGPYAVTAYARTTIRTPAGDIRAIIERASDAYWAPGDGWRETVVAQRRTGNLGAGGESVSSVAGGLVDLLSPDVRIAGHRLVGPTSRDAPATYDVEIASNSALDGQLVVRLAFRPKRTTASAFIGTMDVLFKTADVLAMDVRPGPSFLFPPPVRIEGARYRQQYVPVAADSSLWLPADLRSEFRYGVAFEALLSNEPFQVETASQLSAYRLGAVAPDSLAAGDRVRRAARPDSLRLEAPGVAPPLTADETQAYALGDSLGSLNDVLVFHGPLGALAKKNIDINVGSQSDSTEARPPFAFSFKPRVQVNPAETVHVGGALALRAGPLRVTPYGLFRLSDRGVSLGATASFPLAGGRRSRLWAVGSASDGVARRVAATAPEILEGFANGRGGYYDRRLASAGLSLRVDGLGRSGGGNSSFSFASFERSAVADLRFVAETANAFRPGVLDSDLLSLQRQTARTLRLDAEVGTLDVPAALVPRQSLRVVSEVGAFGGPEFVRVEGVASFRLPTFARRRALPPALDVRVSGGVSTGDLPVFRQFALEHALGDAGVAATTFGALRSRTDTPDAGDRYVLLAYEHSFRTIPFEILGLDALVRRNYNVIVSGAHGRTWGGPLASRRFTHEVGLSLSGLLTGFRIDLTQRLDAPGTVVGFSLARLL